MATLCRMPVVPLFKQFGTASVGLIQKSWCFKTILPTLAGVSSVHALSGATTYVASDSGNSVQGTSGESFNFAFMTGGNYKAFSYTVSGLPASLSYNEDANGPMITGTLPSAGSYEISIIGHRYTGQKGNQTHHSTSRSRLPKQMNRRILLPATKDRPRRTLESVSPWNETNTQSLSAGWSRSSWFGDFYGKEQGWVYHFDHGWIYLKGTDESGFWVHDETLGWLYTGKDAHPFFYRDPLPLGCMINPVRPRQILGLCEQSDHHPQKKLAGFLRSVTSDGFRSDARIVF